MEWKRLFNKRMYIIVIISMFMTGLLYEYKQMSSTQIRNDYSAYMEEKNKYIENYVNDMIGVMENVTNMEKYEIFTKSDSFAYNNIIKTKKDFSRIKDINITMQDDRAVESYLEYDVPFIVIFVLMIMIIYNMFIERDNGVWEMIHCTRYGRTRLALERIAIIIISSGILLMIFSLFVFMLAVVKYGIGGGLSGAVQELIGFEKYTNAYSKIQYLCCFILTSWMVIASLSICVWSLMTIMRERNHALIIVIIIAGVEFLLRTNISKQSVWNGLYYVNIISMLHVNEALTTYLNWGFKTYVFGSTQTGGVLLFAITLIMGSCAVLKYEDMYPKKGASNNIFDRILMKIKSSYHKHMSRYNITMMEFHKVFVTGKGIWILISAIVFSIYFCVTDIMAYTDASKAKDVYYTQYGGKDYSYIENNIENEITKLEELKQTQKTYKKEYDDGYIDAEKYMEASSAVSYQEMVVKGLEEYQEKIDYLKQVESQYGIHGYLMSDRGIEMLLSEESSGRELMLILIIVIACIIINSECVTLEQKCGIYQIIHGAANGRKNFWIRKICVGFASSLYIYIIVNGIDLFVLQKNYSFQYLDAPTISLSFMAEYPNYIVLHTVIWQYIFIRFFIRLLIVLICTLLALLISLYVGKKGNRAVLPISIAVIIVIVIGIHMKIPWLV